MYFSIIIPCYNSEKFVHRAIESALKQDDVEREIILIDNNSTDNTVNILYDYASKFPTIITVLHEPKKGAPAARNKGLFKAKGEFIQFLDSDDELLPGKLKLQLKVAKDSKADIVAGNSFVQKEIDGKLVKQLRNVITTDVWEGLLTSKLGITSANLWRRDALLLVGGWDESKTSSQEYDLLFRMMKNGAKIALCTTPLSVIHVNRNSISNSENANRIIEIITNYISLRSEIKKYLISKNKLTDELVESTDKTSYYLILNWSGEYFWFVKTGKLPTFIRQIIKDYKLSIPIKFAIKTHLKFIKNNLKYIA